MKKAKLWYVIADGGRARFVEQDDRGAFRTVSNFVSTELHKRSEELGLDRPARVQESASPTRHAVEPTRRHPRAEGRLDQVRCRTRGQGAAQGPD
jgi:hypothetical protein